MRKDELIKIIGKLCLNCGGQGAIQIDEDTTEQCQFCDQLLFPAIDELLARETAILAEIDSALNAISSADETGEPDFDSMVNAIVEVKSIIQRRKEDCAK